MVGQGSSPSSWAQPVQVPTQDPRIFEEQQESEDQACTERGQLLRHIEGAAGGSGSFAFALLATTFAIAFSFGFVSVFSVSRTYHSYSS